MFADECIFEHVTYNAKNPKIQIDIHARYDSKYSPSSCNFSNFILSVFYKIAEGVGGWLLGTNQETENNIESKIATQNTRFLFISELQIKKRHFPSVYV